MIEIFRTYQDSERGYTLPEVMVALALFSLIGLAMLDVSNAAYHRDAQHRDTLVATALAQSHIEELLRAGYNDPRLSDPDGGDDVARGALVDSSLFQNPDHRDPKNPLDEEGGVVATRRFTRVWNVRANAPLPGLKTVTVLVGWRDGRGQLQIVGQTIQLARLR